MRPGKILVVDDDPEVRMATRDFLSSKEYEVAVAEGGRGALRMLDASPADVGLLDVAMQAKILRVLQERQFERIGGTRSIGADVRVIAATHQDLGSLDAALEDWERRAILDALQKARGVQAKAAKILGIIERSLWYRVKKLKIQVRMTGESPDPA